MSRSCTCKTKAQAQAWAAEVEAQIASGKVAGLSNKTFGDLLQRYANEVSPTKRSDRFEQYRIESFCEDEIAQVQLASLGPEHFAAWRDRRLKSVSGSTVMREWRILSHACTVAAREWRWLPENPLLRVSKPKEAPPRQRRVHPEEIDRLLLALGYLEGVPPQTGRARVGAALLFAIETAMRAGEICAMCWQHVDLARGLVHIPVTKNGHPRDVPLSSRARALLEVLGVVRNPDDERVFQLKVGVLDAEFRKARDRAMVQDLHFHDTRREALTRLAQKVDVMTLAKISGHRDLRILQNVYYAPDMAHVVARLD
ncbi:tyrosine-type recombinase/integrase [Chitinilyticum aquatile]|uniref:tyrosine-type recombinase/integrase n=1 Tax=Chitinilyticum aquatile TaxID=362520 RepID=UPI000409DB6A|nr:site-specific integrase [Chitinilyticum aquatile]